MEKGKLDLDKYTPPEYLMARLNQQIREMMNTVLRVHGLKLVEWRILQCLVQSENMLTVADLSELAVIDRTVASRLIDRMANAKLLSKQLLKTDRRFAQIKITGKGQSVYKESLQSSNKLREQLFSGFTSKDMETLLVLLAKISANSERAFRF